MIERKSFGLLLLLLVFLPNVGLPRDQLPCSPDPTVQELIDKYGKEAISEFIRVVRHSLITIEVNGALQDFLGPPDPQYVTLCSITVDLRHSALAPEQFRVGVQSAHRLLTTPKPAPQPLIVEEKRINDAEPAPSHTYRASSSADTQLEYHLATLEAGKPVSSEDPLVRFAGLLLESLAGKYPNNTRQQIADMSVLMEWTAPLTG